MACEFYGDLVDTAEDVLEIEDVPGDEPEVVGISMPVRDHPQLMGASRVELEVQSEATAEGAESLRKWAQGLLDAHLERGVPDAAKVQNWRGAIHL